MKEIKDYTVEELLAQIEIMRKTIQLQHATINRLMDAYVLKNTSSITRGRKPKNEEE